MGSVKRVLVWLYALVILAFNLGGFGLYWANRRTPVPSSWSVAGGPRDGFADLGVCIFLGGYESGLVKVTAKEVRFQP